MQTSPAGHAAGVLARAGLLLCMLLAGCGRTPAPTAADFQLDPAEHAQISSHSVRALAADGRDEFGRPLNAATLQALASSGISSSGQFRYVTRDDGHYRVRVDVYPSSEEAAARFRSRHMPEALAMTQSIALADDGFIYRNEYLGFRAGAVAVEIRAKPPHDGLADFARLYAGDIQAKQRR